MERIKSAVNKINFLYVLKAGIGSAIAIWLAGVFHFMYAPSAGIITILTIQNTKRETFEIAIRRMIAFAVAVAISYLVFSSLGYHFLSFGVFILIFIGACYFFDLKDGISMNAVLMTHFLVEKQMGIPMILNEVGIFVIGTGIGIILNLFMPRYKEFIRREQQAVEEGMKEILRGLSQMLRNKEACLIQENSSDKTKGLEESAQPSSGSIEKQLEEDIDRVENMIEALLKKAYEDAGNTLMKNTRYLISYLEMRKHQMEILNHIYAGIQRIPVLLLQSIPLADFMEHTAQSYHELNNARELLRELGELNQYYKNEALPVTRAEFEYRAVLFQILNQFEHFLMIKNNFTKTLDLNDKKNYWEES